VSDEINRLPPSLREKQRYLKFSVHTEEDVDLGEVVNAIWDSALDYLGEQGCSEANLWVIGNRFDEGEQTGTVRVRREKEDDLRAALTLVDQIGGEKGFISVEKVSGSIKKLRDS